MKMKKHGLILLTILCLILAGAMLADAAPDLSIARQVVGSGEHLEQGSYSLHNSLGQPVVGRYSQSETSLCVGFWCDNAGDYAVYLPIVVRN